MERVTLAGTGIETSCLGMGCASLGSRVDRATGLRALAQAHEAGLSWIDTAPAYGAGDAETILAEFLRGRRDAVQICTKVGLVPPPQSALKRAVRRVARPAVAAMGPLRGLIRKSGATANRAVDLTPDLVRGGLERSLGRLGTDRVEIYALHNARPEDMRRDEILRALEDLVTAGKTRALAVAGDAVAASAAIDAAGSPEGVFGAVQFAQPGGSTPGADLFARAGAAGIGCITHSVFGVDGSLAALTARLRRDPDLAARAAAAGFDGPPDAAAARLLLARARADNAEGVVLVSMFSDRSLARNLPAGQAPPHPEAAALCAAADV